MSKPDHQCSTDYFACRPLPLVECTLEHTVSDPTWPFRQLKKHVPESMPPRYNASLPVCRALPAIASSGLILLLCGSSCSRGGEVPYRYKAMMEGTGQKIQSSTYTFVVHFSSKVERVAVRVSWKYVGLALLSPLLSLFVFHLTGHVGRSCPSGCRRRSSSFRLSMLSRCLLLESMRQYVPRNMIER